MNGMNSNLARVGGGNGYGGYGENNGSMYTGLNDQWGNPVFVSSANMMQVPPSQNPWASDVDADFIGISFPLPEDPESALSSGITGDYSNNQGALTDRQSALMANYAGKTVVGMYDIPGNAADGGQPGVTGASTASWYNPVTRALALKPAQTLGRVGRVGRIGRVGRVACSNLGALGDDIPFNIDTQPVDLTLPGFSYYDPTTQTTVDVGASDAATPGFTTQYVTTDPSTGGGGSGSGGGSGGSSDGTSSGSSAGGLLGPLLKALTGGNTLLPSGYTRNAAGQVVDPQGRIVAQAGALALTPSAQTQQMLLIGGGVLLLFLMKKKSR